jgi:hypothetical protein
MAMLATRSTMNTRKPYKSMLMATEFAYFISSWLDVDVDVRSRCLRNSILLFSTVTTPFTISARNTEDDRELTEKDCDKWLAIDYDVQ